MASLEAEGPIPKGRYGAGWRYIWDRGVYVSPEPDLQAALWRGDLSFTLYGHRLNGDYRLFQDPKGDASEWYLQKIEDEFAQHGHVAVVLGKDGPPPPRRAIREVSPDQRVLPY